MTLLHGTEQRMYGALTTSYTSQRWSYLIGIYPSQFPLDIQRVRSSPYMFFPSVANKTYLVIAGVIHGELYTVDVSRGYCAFMISELDGKLTPTLNTFKDGIGAFNTRYTSIMGYYVGKTDLVLEGDYGGYGSRTFVGSSIDCNHSIIVSIVPRSPTSYQSYTRTYSQLITIYESCDANGTIMLPDSVKCKYRFIRLGKDTSIIFTVCQQSIKQNITISLYLFNKDDPLSSGQQDVDEDPIFYNKYMKKGVSKKHTISHAYCNPEKSSGVVIREHNVSTTNNDWELNRSPIYAHAEYISIPISQDWLPIVNGIARYRYRCQQGNQDVWGRCEPTCNEYTSVPISVYDTKNDFPTNVDDIDQNTFYIETISLNIYTYNYLTHKYVLCTDDIVAFNPSNPPVSILEIPDNKIYVSITNGMIYRYLYRYKVHSGPEYKFGPSVGDGWVESSDHIICVIQSIDLDSINLLEFTQSIPDEYPDDIFVAGISNITSDSSGVIGSIDRIAFKFSWSVHSSSYWRETYPYAYTELTGNVYLPYTMLYLTSDIDNELQRVEISKIFAFPGIYYINSSVASQRITAADIGGLYFTQTESTISIEVKNPIPSTNVTYDITPLEKGKSRITIHRPKEIPTVMFFAFSSNQYSDLEETLYTKWWRVTIDGDIISGNYVTNDITTWYYYNPLSTFCNTRYYIEPIVKDFDLGQIILLEYYAENDDFNDTFNTDIVLNWPTPVSSFNLSSNEYVITGIHDEEILYHSCNYWNWEVYDELDNLLYSISSDALSYTVSSPGTYKVVHNTSNPSDISSTEHNIIIT